MARDEQDREDLLAEATALVERAELAIAEDAESVVVGFRRDGSPSVFFGADPVYHFNSANELRRAYCSGLLYKAQHGRLVSLRRERAPGEVHLIHRSLSDDEMRAFLQESVERLSNLRLALARGDGRVVGQAPASADVLGRIAIWLKGLSLPPSIASRPHVGR
jgi:hypothetical protein